MALASITEPLRAANLLSGEALYRWLIVSPDAADAVSSSGFRIVADHRDLTLAPCDLLLVVASLAFDHLLKPRLLARLTSAARDAKAIGGASNGSIVLARAGLLDGYRCRLLGQ